MNRLLIHELLKWQASDSRKPILLDGARQVGKTYLLENLFGKENFNNVHKLDFLANPSLSKLFDESLEPSIVLNNIEIHLNISIDIKNDLIFFDEIGESQAAVNSLKYFSEQLPNAFICSTGSNIGLLDSFPVGKVQILELFPLCFEEFLMASDNQKLLGAFKEQSRLKSTHDLLWKALLDYYYVGGMPEAVTNWYKNKSKGMHERTEIVKQVHRNLIDGYLRDFGKYSGKVNAQHIESVFRNVPRQLSKNIDSSVKRFIFKDVIIKKQRYTELSSPINWLEKTKLISKCYPINSQPRMPLASLIKENIFKLFFFDVGLLGHLLGMEYKDQLDQSTSYKGYIAENFVQNEIRTHIGYPIYSWEEGQSEIEFLHRAQDGEIIPIEVKSGSRTRAKSLTFYSKRYHPSKTIKLIGAAGGNNENKSSLVWPLYYTQFLSNI